MDGIIEDMDGPKRREGIDDTGKWTRIAKALEGWIESGKLRGGQRLPGSGELCARLAVSAPTLRKSLSRLYEAGWIEQVSGGWKVASQRRVGSIAMGLLRRCGPEGQTVGEADREAFFRRALELEGARRGVRIETWGISEEGGLFRQTRPWKSDPTEAIQGLVLSIWGMPDPRMAFEAARNLRLPIAIWEESPQPGKRPSFARCRWFQSAHSPTGGEQAARHLLELGHRGLAWISPFHGSSWSRKRLEGIRIAIAASRKPVELACFVREDHRDPLEYTPSRAQVLEMAGDLGRIHPGASRRRQEEYLEKGQAFLRERRILDSVESLFEAALAHRDLTSWICANDDIALLAAGWLAQRGVEVGADISVVGFDNTLRAQDEGISSVDFLEQDLATGMMNFLLDPDRWKSGRTTFLRGSLVPRSSSGRHRPSVG